ncbi:MAG: IS630 family transposase, partial [Methylobacterium sp.]|nr:IS630 family transposase [Methylobacterium sp.]
TLVETGPDKSVHGVVRWRRVDLKRVIAAEFGVDYHERSVGRLLKQLGQKNGIVGQWARRGTRPRQPADQRYESAYLFGAICPARGVGAALALPFADTEAMQMHIDEIALHVARGAHAVLLLDRAGWHTTGNLRWPKNITPILLPSRSPELNPVEQVWQFLRANYLSNRVFETYDDIIDAACDAWRNLIALPQTITSIGSRDWAHIGQS